MAVAISVILATHDRAASLQRTVASVLSQRRLPAELIIVNDAASDIPAEIARSVRAAGVAFRYCTQPVASLTASRNRGIDLAGGEVVLLSDDDMVFPDDYIARLAALYEQDRDGVVAGIGGRIAESSSRGFAGRVWDVLAAAFARDRWTPRRCAARFATLPPGLVGRLTPAQRFSGAAVSVRRKIAAACRFDEWLDGYALGEDMEFSFRLGRVHPLFIADELVVLHTPAPGGRGDMRSRGRMYGRNMLHIAGRCIEPGAGRTLLLAYHFAGMLGLYTTWSLASRRRDNLDFAIGLAGELAAGALAALRKDLCGY